MKKDLMVFNNEEFGEVRVAKIGDKEWFVAKDVAISLGYSNPQKAIRDHCKGVNEIETPTNGGIQTLKYISE
ncbi:MAG: BRO-N domain-containing protein, partial [Clostridium sp.]|uniref:BRO-N domain-containing protein n=1 Tax=Clostridium sp. TaxID=1506 RepID=UPI003EE753C2